MTDKFLSVERREEMRGRYEMRFQLRYGDDEDATKILALLDHAAEVDVVIEELQLRISALTSQAIEEEE